MSVMDPTQETLMKLKFQQQIQILTDKIQNNHQLLEQMTRLVITARACLLFCSIVNISCNK